MEAVYEGLLLRKKYRQGWGFLSSSYVIPLFTTHFVLSRVPLHFFKVDEGVLSF